MGELKNLPKDCRPTLRITDASVDVDPSTRMELELYYNHLDLMIGGRYIATDELLPEVYAAITRVKVSVETKGFLTGRAELYAKALFQAGN